MAQRRHSSASVMLCDPETTSASFGIGLAEPSSSFFVLLRRSPNDQQQEEESSQSFRRTKSVLSGALQQQQERIPEDDESSSSSPIRLAQRNNNNNSAPSKIQPALFASGTASYRIYRLALELFLVEHIESSSSSSTSSSSVSTASYIFIAYRVANAAVSLAFLLYPTLWLGSYWKGVVFFLTTVTLQAGGFLGVFLFENLALRMVAAALSGIGASCWFVNYQTITITAFPKKELSKVAKLRQLFECIGFLLPSICLAIVSSSSTAAASTMNEEDNVGTIIEQCSIVLTVAGLVFFLAGVQSVVYGIAHTTGQEQVNLLGQGEQSSLWTDMKRFCSASVFQYFVLDSILLAASSVLFATLSLTTKKYFGFEGSSLWIAAIGIPIGGGAAAIASVKTQKDDRCVTTRSSFELSIMFVILIACAGLTPIQNAKVAKTLLFLFGVVTGAIYSFAYASAYALWLKELKDYDAGFATRANVLHGMGVQVIIAVIFQMQSMLIDYTLDQELNATVNALALFGPLAFLFFAAFWTAHRLGDSECRRLFGFARAPLSLTSILLIKVLRLLGVGSAEDNIFMMFSDYRSTKLSKQLNPTTIGRGPTTESRKLRAQDLKNYLEEFDTIRTTEQWWYSSSVQCSHLFLSNTASFAKRMELIEGATTSIFVLTWSWSGNCGHTLAAKLIKKAQSGLSVCVMVDAINVCCLDERRKLLGPGKDLELLKMMHKKGVNIKMLQTWHNLEDERRSYVCGSHRKLLLVDNKHLLMGGRNLEDAYTFCDGGKDFHFQDCDVLLMGDFTDTTRVLSEELWDGAQGIARVVEAVPYTCKDPSVSKDATDKSDLKVHTKDLDSLSAEAKYDSFYQKWAARASEELKNSSTNLQLFQLDHKAGDLEGYDIILSTILFLLDTAEDTIDMYFGYFQLFPCLEAALVGATERGVKTRLFTNSYKTNDLHCYDLLVRKTLVRLRELGVELFEPFDDGAHGRSNFTFHCKMLLVDSRAFLVGSWNCIGASIFYDAEYSIVIMKDEKDDASVDCFTEVRAFFEDSLVLGRFVALKELPPDTLPFHYSLLASKYAMRHMLRGY